MSSLSGRKREQIECARAKNPMANVTRVAERYGVSEEIVLRVWTDMDRINSGLEPRLRWKQTHEIDETRVVLWMQGVVAQDQRWTPERLEAAKRLRAEGKTMPEIAELLHTHPGSVSKHLSGKRTLVPEAECGTMDGFNQHRRLKTHPCPPCLDARRRAWREHRRANPVRCPHCPKILADNLGRHIRKMHPEAGLTRHIRDQHPDVAA